MEKEELREQQQRKFMVNEGVKIKALSELLKTCAIKKMKGEKVNVELALNDVDELLNDQLVFLFLFNEIKNKYLKNF